MRPRARWSRSCSSTSTTCGSQRGARARRGRPTNRQVADRLRAAAPSSALVGRVGGDEFVVTLRLPTSDAAVRLAAALRAEVRRSMPVGSLTLDVDVAVGVVVHPDHGSDPATLLQRADVASRAARPRRRCSCSTRLWSHARRGGWGSRRTCGTRSSVTSWRCTSNRRWRCRTGGWSGWNAWPAGTPSAWLVAPEDFVAVAEHTGAAQPTHRGSAGGRPPAVPAVADDGNPVPIAVNFLPYSGRPWFPGRVAALLEETAWRRSC